MRQKSARLRRRPLLPILAALLALLLIAAFWLLASWPSSTLYGPVTAHGPRSDRLVALTFDDGPNAGATAQILDILKAEGAPATFFVTGAGALAAPELVRRAVIEGHVVGNHSMRHRKRDALFDLRYGEAAATQRAIEQAAGVTPAFYRPPNGFHTPWSLRAVRRAGMRTLVWDVDPYDWKDPAPETLIRRILADVRPGSIILLHDGIDTRQDADRTATVAALPGIIDGLRAHGYRLVTVAELLGDAPYQGRGKP